MTAFLRKNFAHGVLASNIDSDDEQITVEVGHALPITAGEFVLVIWDMENSPNPADDPNTEIVTASYSGTPNIYDIIRGQEYTLAVNHIKGSEVALHYTAGMSKEDLNYLGTFEIDETDVGTGYFVQADLFDGDRKLKFTNVIDCGLSN